VSDRRVESLARVICEYSLQVEPGQLMLIEAPALAEPLVLEIESFLRVVREGGRPEVDAEDGLWAVGIARALLESAAERRVVDLARLAAQLAARFGERPMPVAARPASV